MRKSHSEYKDDRLRSLSVSLEASSTDITSLIFDSSSFIKSRDFILLAVYSFIPTCYSYINWYLLLLRKRRSPPVSLIIACRVQWNHRS